MNMFISSGFPGISLCMFILPDVFYDFLVFVEETSNYITLVCHLQNSPPAYILEIIYVPLCGICSRAEKNGSKSTLSVSDIC